VRLENGEGGTGVEEDADDEDDEEEDDDEVDEEETALASVDNILEPAIVPTNRSFSFPLSTFFSFSFNFSMAMSSFCFSSFNFSIPFCISLSFSPCLLLRAGADNDGSEEEAGEEEEEEDSEETEEAEVKADEADLATFVVILLAVEAAAVAPVTDVGAGTTMGPLAWTLRLLACFAFFAEEVEIEGAEEDEEATPVLGLDNIGCGCGDDWGGCCIFICKAFNLRRRLRLLEDEEAEEAEEEEEGPIPLAKPCIKPFISLFKC